MRDDGGGGDFDGCRSGDPMERLLQAVAVGRLALSDDCPRLASRATVGYYLAQFRHDLGNVG
jgi:hypothetical protein